jgi:hypothetical protein
VWSQSVLEAPYSDLCTPLPQKVARRQQIPASPRRTFPPFSPMTRERRHLAGATRQLSDCHALRRASRETPHPTVHDLGHHSRVESGIQPDRAS